MQEPLLSSRAIKGNLVAVALDSCLHVLRCGDQNSDEDISSFSPISVIFSADIDSLCWSPCQNFVLAGLRSGQAQMLHLESKMPLPAVRVAEERELAKKEPCFVGCHFVGKNLQLVGSDGKVRSSNFS